MKTVVFAYHDMGCLGIEALLSAGYEISAIFTHTDNPGEKAFYGSVARLAAERGIPVYAPDNVNHPLWVERIAQLSPEVIFSFYYRHLICDEILQLAPAGAFNLHGSLLPKYRGRAPLNWVLVNGETETGYIAPNGETCRCRGHCGATAHCHCARRYRYYAAS